MDAHVRSDRGSANFGDSTRLRAKSDARAYLWFDIDKPPGATLVSASLELYSVGTGWSGQTATVQKLNQKWSEGKVTWDNKPTAEATTVAGNAAIAAALQLVTFACTALVGVGTAWRGLDVRVTGTGDGRGFASAEYPDPQYRPRLVLTWTEAATEPIDLKPTNDNAVATRSPTLTWDWGASNEQLADVNVQIDGDGADFSVPDYDSGWVASTEHSFTLPALTLPASGIRDWRVRVRTASGVIGPWSDPAGVQYVAQPALVITAPTAFDTDTPRVTWTFTGQERARVFVYNAAGKLLHTSPWLSTELLYEIPDDVIFGTGSFTFRVHAWDTVVREAVPGFPDYATDDQVAAFAFSGVVSGVSTLTATQPGTEPFVRLTWTRGVQPDIYRVFVDGVKVTELAGTVLTYDLWEGFVPGTSHIYEVMAGVGNPPALSATNIDAVLTPRAIGAWLFRESDLSSLQVLNESAAYAYVDDTAFYRPIASTYAVAISGETHGVEMGLTGVITARAKRDLLESYARDDQPVRLVTGDINALVQVTNLAVDPGPQGTFDVSFNATQVGA